MKEIANGTSKDPVVIAADVVNIPADRLVEANANSVEPDIKIVAILTKTPIVLDPKTDTEGQTNGAKIDDETDGNELNKVGTIELIYADEDSCELDKVNNDKPEVNKLVATNTVAEDCTKLNDGTVDKDDDCNNGTAKELGDITELKPAREIVTKEEGAIKLPKELGNSKELTEDKTPPSKENAKAEEMDKLPKPAMLDSDKKGVNNGELNAKDCDNNPDIINGKPLTPLGKENGRELKPGNDETDQIGPQIGKVADETKEDIKLPIGSDDKITNGATIDAKNGNTTVKLEFNEKYNGNEVIDCDGSIDKLNGGIDDNGSNDK